MLQRTEERSVKTHLRVPPDHTKSLEKCERLSSRVGKGKKRDKQTISKVETSSDTYHQLKVQANGLNAPNQKKAINDLQPNAP